MNKKMLFKVGLTVIILTAWYMYYAIRRLEYEEKGTVISGQPVESSPTVEEPHGKSVHIKQSESDELKDTDQVLRHKSERWKNSLHLAVVSCGDRQEESLVMLKSAVLFSKSPLVFHIFTDEESQKGFKDKLEFWPPEFQKRVQYYIYNLSFPPDPNRRNSWKTLFKPCASQRLFIPDLLRDVDALVYVDTDVLFLSPLNKIWDMFAKFNSTQLAGVSPEHEDKQTGWYNRFARHPFYGELGINSGVMLMNLTRIRASSWLQSLKNFYNEYKLKITFGDQDLINIYFHFHPDQLYMFPCEWNYRPDHCMYMSVCQDAENVGAYILHGCRRVWHDDKQPAFKQVYRVFKEHRLGASIQYDLLESLTLQLDQAMPSNCGKLKSVFTKQIQSYVEDLHSPAR